jgi:hypothetical protein
VDAHVGNPTQRAAFRNAVRETDLMGASEIYRQKAELLLRLSHEAHDPKTRAYLLDEALYWHREATEAAGIDRVELPADKADSPAP